MSSLASFYNPAEDLCGTTPQKEQIMKSRFNASIRIIFLIGIAIGCALVVPRAPPAMKPRIKRLLKMLLSMRFLR